jgi:hypothetical protein
MLLTPEERRKFADMQKMTRRLRVGQPCPFQSTPGDVVNCNKESGVCSLRLYVKRADGQTAPADPPKDRLRCTCPNRFKEDKTIYHWVAETILGQKQSVVLKEIPFLESTIQPDVASDKKPMRSV